MKEKEESTGRNNFRSSMKEHSGKERMNRNGYGGDDEDYLVGFSWPPRSYTCSFCKREFKSAQALGGHMNVHRRDRARLRHYSSPKDQNYSFLNLSLSPSPNPNFSSSSSSSSFGNSHPFPSSLPSLVFPHSELKKNNWGLSKYSSSPKPSYLSNTSKGKSYFELLDPFTDETQGNMTLDQETGHELSDSKEDLDLELRLGYS